MAFIAILLLGIIASLKIPVSLMPDIDIPEITVRVTYPDTPARLVEKNVVSPLRSMLQQVGHLDDLVSETRDGYSIINLRFNYGTDINYAFMETNEKIDRAMNNIPKDVDRPKVIKASATDIPVFYLNINLKEDSTYNNTFMELSDFVKAVIIKRIEQLKQVALVDISGFVSPELKITPDYKIMKSLNITDQDIQNAINANNKSTQGLNVREGHYLYSIKFSSRISTKEDVENIYIKKQDRILQLKEIAKIEKQARKRSGLFTNRNNEALCLAIIKQPDSRMDELKEELDFLIDNFITDYPNLVFDIEKDQTTILDTSINNLKQSLLYGAILAFLIMFLFLKDFKSPILIGITIPASVIVSFLFLYLFNISINIISLSGLVLCVGMMIDNSIIVIDNINQYMQKDYSLDDSCIHGTNEVIRPLISSALTTSAVFIPLIFLSGISGALFYDQAIAVTIGLFVSLLVSITLLPTIFRVFYLRKSKRGQNRMLARINTIDYEQLYEKGIHSVFKRKLFFGSIFIVLIPVGVFLFNNIDKQRLPDVGQSDLLTYIDWNENIHVEENADRVSLLVNSLTDSLVQYSALIGEQQFILDRRTREMGSSESNLYFRTKNIEALNNLRKEIRLFINNKYPRAKLEFGSPENIFDAIFSENQPPLLAEISSVIKTKKINPAEIDNISNILKSKIPGIEINPVPLREHIIINVDPELLLIYDVEINRVVTTLKSAFSQHNIGILKSYQSFTPIVIGERTRLVNEIIDQTMVKNNEGKELPLRSIVKLSRETGFKTIVAGSSGEFVPLALNHESENYEGIMKEINSLIRPDPEKDVGFSGSFFTNKKLFAELGLVLLISCLLLYFILAAQFESFIQPIIVLLELPIDIAGALFLLYIFGGTVNIMSAIGIIVMSGIIINDSILKIDTINRLRRSGKPIVEAITIGGQRRLKPILMTSLTTILALVPFLLFSGLGAELQRPLALTVIGGMFIGTFVSLYFIPLAYWAVYKVSSGKKAIKS